MLPDFFGWCRKYLIEYVIQTIGDFRRPQQGKKKTYEVCAEGGVNLDKIYLWGEFRYSRNAIKDANFNASIIDPFRGMPIMLPIPM